MHACICLADRLQAVSAAARPSGGPALAAARSLCVLHADHASSAPHAPRGARARAAWGIHDRRRWPHQCADRIGSATPARPVLLDDSPGRCASIDTPLAADHPRVGPPSYCPPQVPTDAPSEWGREGAAASHRQVGCKRHAYRRASRGTSSGFGATCPQAAVGRTEMAIPWGCQLGCGG